jgi:quercetin dioxygenase-like cupin family protein
MAGMTRREVVVGVAGMVTVGSGVAAGQAVPPASDAPLGDFAKGARVFALGTVTATKAANGSERKQVFAGRLATGEAVTMHESRAPAGTAAAPAHTIAHSEFVVMMEGTLEFVHNGKTDRAVAGDVIYVAYGTNHQVRNVGDGVARYMVFQMGGDTKW